MVNFKPATKTSIPMPQNNVDALYESVMALKQLVENLQLQQGEQGLPGDQGDPGPAGPPGPGALLAAPTYDTLATHMTFNGAYAADNSIPQIGGGNRVFLRNYTALNAAHRIRVHVTGNAYSTLAGNYVTALFIDGAANAVISNFGTHPAGYCAPIALDWEGVLAPGAHSFEIRIGQNTAGFYLNGNSAGPLGGGTLKWVLQIEELNAP